MQEWNIAQVEKELARTRMLYRAVLDFPVLDLALLPARAQAAHHESIARLERQGKALAEQLAQLKREEGTPCNP